VRHRYFTLAQALEADRIANEAAKNSLETFIYGTKEKLEKPEYLAVSTGMLMVIFLSVLTAMQRRSARS
jgi:hypothetical protein